MELPSEYTDTCSGVVRVWPAVANKEFCGEGEGAGLRGRAGLLGLAWDEVRFSLVSWDELRFSRFSFPDFVEVRSGVTGKEVCVVGGVPGRGGSGM